MIHLLHKHFLLHEFDYAYIKQSDGAGGSGASLRIGNMNDGGIKFLVG